jgi:hypothetical protein
MKSERNHHHEAALRSQPGPQGDRATYSALLAICDYLYDVVDALDRLALPADDES